MLFQTIDGAEALNYLRQSADLPGLILLDIAMPKMTGWEFLGHQQRDPRLSTIPVVLMSALAHIDCDERALSAVAMVGKPMDLPDLEEVLHTHLTEAHSGTPVADGLMQLHAEIHAERQELEHLIARLHFTESVPRKVGAWLGEKVAQLKLQMDDKATGAMHLFEGLEAAAIGIQGKRALWRVLGVVSENAPELRGLIITNWYSAPRINTTV